jgi:hypothetical protein
MHILLAIKGYIYEVSKFVSHHPGEGIRNVYLYENNKRDVSNQFDHFHTSNESEEYLIEARKGNHPTIKYIAPYYFQKRIPRYYHYIDNGIQNIKQENIPNKSYLLFQSNDNDKTINLFVKDAMGFISVHHLELVINEENNKLEKCFVQLCDNIDENENVEINTIEDVTIEGFIDKYFKGQGYNPILKPEFN